MEREEKWKLMIGSLTKNGERREMETDQKRGDKRNGNVMIGSMKKWKLMIGSVTKNGGRREMETYDRICDQ